MSKKTNLVAPEKALLTADEGGLAYKVSTHSKDIERNEILTKVWPCEYGKA